MRYTLSLINTERKSKIRGMNGEENCTCSSDEEEDVIPVTSVARVATTEYGGREIVETEENLLHEYRGVHKDIF